MAVDVRRENYNYHFENIIVKYKKHFAKASSNNYYDDDDDNDDDDDENDENIVFKSAITPLLSLKLS